MADIPLPAPDSGRLAELRASARGWHGVQLAVLGFIGLCGVIKQTDATAPRWLQALAGVLVLAALAAACVATFLVGRAAWPLYGGRANGDESGELRRTSRSITTGLALTFGAVAMLALASAIAWWPAPPGGRGAVEVRAGEQAWCGRLADSEPGTLTVETSDRPVVLAIGQLTRIRPVDGCG